MPPFNPDHRTVSIERGNNNRNPLSYKGLNPWLDQIAMCVAKIPSRWLCVSYSLIMCICLHSANYVYGTLHSMKRQVLALKDLQLRKTDTREIQENRVKRREMRTKQRKHMQVFGYSYISLITVENGDIPHFLMHTYVQCHWWLWVYPPHCHHRLFFSHIIAT